MAKNKNKQQLMANAKQHRLFVVKKKMDNGFLLAVYDKDGKTPIYHHVSQEPSETAYDRMYSEANFAVQDYLGIRKSWNISELNL